MSWSTATATAPFDSYDVETTITYDSGLCVMPVSARADGSPVPPQVVKTKSDLCYKIIRWSVSRNGQKPPLPDPTPTDGNLTLLRAIIKPVNIMPTDEGTFRFTFSGQYTYVCAVPPWSTDPTTDRKPAGFQTGTTPAVTDGMENFQVYSADFVHGIIPN